MSINDNFIRFKNDVWDNIADDWDVKMGLTDNRYHREIIRPATLKLLAPLKDDLILDIACGTGNFSRYLESIGAKVVAFDSSVKMIQYAKNYNEKCDSKVEFHVADTMVKKDLLNLRKIKPYDKAVSNMALMNMENIDILLDAVYDMLVHKGVFVFSVVHPCFQTPDMKKIIEQQSSGNTDIRIGITVYDYITPCEHYVSALSRNKKQVIHYHRPISLLLNKCFDAGFIAEGIEEPTFEKEKEYVRFDWYNIPPSLIIKLRKN